jgi:hypothetical protein
MRPDQLLLEPALEHCGIGSLIWQHVSAISVKTSLGVSLTEAIEAAGSSKKPGK